MLTKEQMSFLKTEFNISKIDYSDSQILQNIRLKCFDIETEECMKRITEEGDATSDIGKRGNMAVSIIDDLYDIMYKNKITFN